MSRGVMHLFRTVSRYGTRIIAAAALVGLAVPELAAALRPYIGDFVVTMLIVSLMRVDFAAFVSRIRRPLPAIAATVWVTVLFPVAVMWGAVALGVDTWSASALAIVFLFVAPPPIVSAPAFAMLMGLDGALVLAVMLLATTLMPLTAPWLAALFVADTLPISAFDLSLRLATMIGTAFVIAFILRKVLKSERIERAKPLFDTVGVSIAVMFAIGAMDGVGERLVSDPVFTLSALGIAVGVCFAMIVLSYALFRPFVGVDAVAIGYCAGNRNAGLVVAALGVEAVDPMVWFFFAMTQVPVFVFPFVLAPLGRYLSRAQGPGPSPGSVNTTRSPP